MILNVVRDLLDEQVVDRNGREMGRVDGILLEPIPGRPPRLAAIIIGPSALGARLHPRLGRLVKNIERYFGLAVGRPAFIDFTNIAQIHGKVRLDLAIGETEVEAVERRLRRWILRLPGSG
jgi:hypothetical protein